MFFSYICLNLLEELYLKHLISIWMVLGLLFSVLQKTDAENLPYSQGGRLQHSADSIMERVFFFAPFYESIVESYKAELYIKGKVNVKKKNFIIHYLPTMFRTKKGMHEYMMETYSELHFTAPNRYEQEVKASMGTTTGFWEADGRLLEHFHINIYSSTLLYDKLLSPLASDARKYYTYLVDSVMGGTHNRQYKVRFIPKNKSYQLVGGYMIVSADVWSIREIRFSGRSEMYRFTNHLKMGEVGAPDEFLTLHYDVTGAFRFLGNVIDASYVATLDYWDIRQQRPAHMVQRSGSKYDLSGAYKMSAVPEAYRYDTAQFNRLRPIPLTPHEQELYHGYSQLSDSSSVKKSNVLLGQFGGALIDYYTVDLNDFGRLRCSPLINPFMFGYSAFGGLSYRQVLRYNRLFTGDRRLFVGPGAGYNFKQKEFYWQVKSDFDYYPRKRATLHVEFGNGNRVYSSAILDELKDIPDSVFDVSKLRLNYYKDLYLLVRHSWEIVNGLTLDINLSMHRRTDTAKGKFTVVDSDASSVSQSKPEQPSVSPEIDTGVLNKLARVYNSFAPGIRLAWTPGQYYYMSGQRKVNLHSKYPTISLDWERGIKGVLPNSNTYERFEVDFQHTIPLGLMRDFYYRLGWGVFTEQDGIYFIDFANFRRTNLPMGWNDDFGGVFQLLDRYWYNSSRKYLRGHITYEAPFLLIPHLNKVSQYVLNERLYFGALFVPRLNPYIELGYGIGTHIFDFGVFAGFENWKYKEVGVKFTFELFNR